MYISNTANAGSGSCDIVIRNSIDCADGFGTNLVYDNDNAIVDLATAARDTAVDDNTIIGTSWIIWTRQNNIVEGYENFFGKLGQLLKCFIDHRIDL